MPIKNTVCLLLVDDREEERDLIKADLEEARAHVEILEAATIEEGIECLENNDVDCVFVDYSLQDGDGLEFRSTALRFGFDFIPMVLLTGHDDEEVGIAALEEGMKDYLVKGEGTPRRLMRTIRFAMRRQEEENRLRSTNEELEQARSRMKEEVEYKERFFRQMSDEVRTPLAGILRMADVLHETTLTEEQRECVQAIDSSANYLLTVVNEIVDYSKMQAGKWEIQREEFPFVETVEDFLRPLQGRASKKGVSFFFEQRGEIPKRIHSDANILRKVLVNLVGNAIKFTSEGGEVRVVVERDPQHPQQLLWKVSDTGVGIPKKEIDAIFSAFYQVDGPKRNNKGTGLGLAIVYDLVMRLQGGVWVESEEGKGTTFYFTLPLT